MKFHFQIPLGFGWFCWLLQSLSSWARQQHVEFALLQRQQFAVSLPVFQPLSWSNTCRNFTSPCKGYQVATTKKMQTMMKAASQENHPFKDCKLQTTEQTLSSKGPIQPDVTVALDQMLKSGGAAMAVSAQARATSYGCSKCAPNALAPWGQNSALW